MKETHFAPISQGNSLPDPDLACLSSSISNLTPAHTHTHTHTHCHALLCMHAHAYHTHVHTYTFWAQQCQPGCNSPNTKLLTHGFPCSPLSSQPTPTDPSKPNSDMTTFRKPFFTILSQPGYSPLPLCSPACHHCTAFSAHLPC